jgi:NAD+ kinase
MRTIGILHHPTIAASHTIAAEMCDWLEAKGIHTWQASSYDGAEVSLALDDTELLVVLGGDGSLLRAARYSTPHGVPLFGVNLGKVGFLTEAQPEEWRNKLARYLVGDCWIENRLMLHAALQRDGRIVDTFTALNDLVVGRGKQARVVRFQLYVDGDPVTHYTADALIVATPTGSTAYAMAAGGPLLPPQLQNFVILPVAAHLSFDRALILHETAEIAITITLDHEAYITPDGQHGISAQNGDTVLIKKDDYACRFARVDNAGYFYRRLMNRLGYIRQDERL